MKNLFLKVSFLAISAALFLIGTLYGRQGAPRSQAGPEPKILHYVDPMNPAHTSDKPGLAPCGMKMEPVYAESESRTGGPSEATPPTPGTIRVSTAKRQLIGVQAVPVAKTPVSENLRLFGRVVPDERRVYRLNAGMEGLVREVSTVTIGSQVKKDQWLATFSSPDIRSTIAGFLTAVDVVDRQKQSGGNTSTQLSIVEANARLAADRLEALGLSTLQIEEIRASREIPYQIRILAPADGFILSHTVTPGVKFEKGAEWYRIADLSRVWILVDVFANEAEYIQPGVAAQVSVPGHRKPFTAHVSEVLPQFDPATRTLKVRFEAENPGILLRPEMFVDVAVTVTHPPTLAVPADAVLDSGLRTAVFVDRGDGCFEPRAVETGRRLGGQVEIVSGLEPGELVVVSGNFLLDSESRIKLAAAGSQSVSAKDPVCGMRVDESEARAAQCFSQHGGKTYYFCNESCKESFDKAPARFTQQGTVASNSHQKSVRPATLSDSKSDL